MYIFYNDELSHENYLGRQMQVMTILTKFKVHFLCKHYKICHMSCNFSKFFKCKYPRLDHQMFLKNQYFHFSILYYSSLVVFVFISQKFFSNGRDQTCSIYGTYQFGNLFNCNVMSWHFTKFAANPWGHTKKETSHFQILENHT